MESISTLGKALQKGTSYESFVVVVYIHIFVFRFNVGGVCRSTDGNQNHFTVVPTAYLTI